MRFWAYSRHRDSQGLADIGLCGAPHVPDAVLLARRPDRPYRVALARGTLAPPGRCAAVHRSGNNSSVLAVPRSMCVRTLSKYLPTSKSILSVLATSDIKLAFRTFASRDPMNNQFFCALPHDFCSLHRGRSWSRKTSVACCASTEILRVELHAS